MAPEPRLKAGVWVAAYLARLRTQDIPAFVVARGDTTAAGVPRLVAIRDQYERAPSPKELVVLDGSAHAQLVFRTAEGDRLLGEILRFLGAP